MGIYDRVLVDARDRRGGRASAVRVQCAARLDGVDGVAHVARGECGGLMGARCLSNHRHRRRYSAIVCDVTTRKTSWLYLLVAWAIMAFLALATPWQP